MSRALTRAGLVTTAAVTLLACATTPSVQSTWRHPSVAHLNVEGKRVAALVLSDDEAIRHGAEDALARGISAHGGMAVPAYTLLPQDLVHDKKRAKELLEQGEVEGVVAMRAVAWNAALLPNQGTYWGSPQSASFWESGFWGWGDAPDGSQRLNSLLVVETLIYSLAENKLVWASRSQTMDASEVGPFIRDLSRKLGAELQKQGLLADPAHVAAVGF